MKPKNVEEYIEALDGLAQAKCIEMRSILKEVAPQAIEGLKWGKPVFESETILFAYAAHKAHISFVPTGPALLPFLQELSEFTMNKDSVQFPYNKPLPVNLIQKIATFRKQDAEERGAKWKY